MLCGGGYRECVLRCNRRAASGIPNDSQSGSGCPWPRLMRKSKEQCALRQRFLIENPRRLADAGVLHLPIGDRLVWRIGPSRFLIDLSGLFSYKYGQRANTVFQSVSRRKRPRRTAVASAFGGGHVFWNSFHQDRQ